MKSGKLLFELRGYKLKGIWTLFRTKGRGGSGKEWLLVKKPDFVGVPTASVGLVAR